MTPKLEAAPTPKRSEEEKNPYYLLQRDVMTELGIDEQTDREKALATFNVFRRVIKKNPHLLEEYNHDPQQAVADFREKIDEEENKE